MIFDGSNQLDTVKAKARLEWLVENGKRFELKELRRKRTVKQNSYLHLILSWWAAQTGYTNQEAKDIMKQVACKNEFVYTLEVPANSGKKKEFYRSTADPYFDTKKMTIVVEKFRNWAQVETGIYLPSPEERLLLDQIQNEINRYGTAQYL